MDDDSNDNLLVNKKPVNKTENNKFENEDEFNNIQNNNNNQKAGYINYSIKEEDKVKKELFVKDYKNKIVNNKKSKYSYYNNKIIFNETNQDITILNQVIWKNK